VPKLITLRDEAVNYLGALVTYPAGEADNAAMHDATFSALERRAEGLAGGEV